MDFVTTGDGSKTIFNAQVGEHYHSKHGAVQESKHVFLTSGLHYFLENQKHPQRLVSILEVGFGTGLNFLLTADYCFQQGIDLHYTGIEAYPLSLDTIKETGYQQVVNATLWETFLKQYEGALSKKRFLLQHITWEIAHQLVLKFNTMQKYDILYFDAFAAVHQPEMWSTETLSHVCNFLIPGGVFVTYAITGNLKRTMKSLGFSIEKAPGAPGKREMLRAVKN
ncbi:tRNA (5-methylaminomethyl-2-thiouridine)(34)-methyltransferase MnmD [Olivibacter ginsenosidimutans]|uniref:tRNA (5-methylaminomethyl-2-thiouridine)(34)-methyltransferase MnmD n=1 Tax=Olivibacter ginsenosidimutans TaxID=1176537 RepID=A0ABP9BBI2_9SPHI